MPPHVSSSSPTSNQAWFLGAPWTKFTCLSLLLFQVLYGNNKQKFSYFMFHSTGDFVIGLIFVAIQLRRLERELGSRQFGEWLLMWILIPSTLIFRIGEFLLAYPGADLRLPPVLISACVYWYTLYTPRLHPNFVSVAGIRFSEKALTQMWGLFLLGHDFRSQIAAAIAGMIASAMYFSIGYQFNLIPNAMVNLVPWEGIASLFLLDPPPKIYAPLLAQQQQSQQRAQRRGFQQPPIPPPRPSPPPQEAVDQLTAMGFEEDRVRQALQQSNNNVERAADRLLTG